MIHPFAVEIETKGGFYSVTAILICDARLGAYFAMVPETVCRFRPIEIGAPSMADRRRETRRYLPR